MLVTQCDTCRKTGPQLAEGWVIATTIEPVSPLAVFSSSPGAEAVTFCSWRCLGEYAAVKALLAETGGGGAGT